MLEQIAGTSSLVTLSAYLWKTVGPPVARNLSCSACVNSVSLHRHFPLFRLPQTIHVSLTSENCLCGYCSPSWPFLPLINKINLFTPFKSLENEQSVFLASSTGSQDTHVGHTIKAARYVAIRETKRDYVWMKAFASA